MASVDAAVIIEGAKLIMDIVSKVRAIQNSAANGDLSTEQALAMLASIRNVPTDEILGPREQPNGGNR